LAFSDDVAFSPGSENAPGTRNAPGLSNVVYHPYFTREGGVPTLEMQVLVPVQEHNEFNSNILEIAERISQNSEYVQMSQAAYGRDPDAFVITRAIANFERSLISGNSAYDQENYQNIAGSMSLSEKRGQELFFSDRTQCSNCHSGFNFSNYAFENNGLYAAYTDPGRYRLTGDSADLAKFKVPSLRNVAVTAPYMHDGSMASLEEVIEHYQSGGFHHINKSELIQPLDLTEQEQQDLIAFLHALTDYSFCQNPIFRP
jgi:cytochrome c peroxidase